VFVLTDFSFYCTIFGLKTFVTPGNGVLLTCKLAGYSGSVIHFSQHSQPQLRTDDQSIIFANNPLDVATAE